MEGGQVSEATLWCAVANVVPLRAYGPGGAEIRTGTKHFAPNAKVYVVSYFWGMGGDEVTVIGHHRKSHRLVSMVIASRHLINWRAKLVYKPAILEQIAANTDWNGVLSDEEKIRRIVDNFNRKDTPTS